MEYTGFTVNMVSGNYEFANLIVVEDESWWTQYGGLIEANWSPTAYIAIRASTETASAISCMMSHGATRVCSLYCKGYADWTRSAATV
jgi:hypothetical protein